MFEKDLWNEIFQSIRKNKLRSMLSGFTIAFAILIFTLLFGMANGLKNTFESFFLDDATNLIYIRSGKTSLPYKGNQTDKKINFSNKDYEHVKSHYQEKIEFITARIFKRLYCFLQREQRQLHHQRRPSRPPILRKHQCYFWSIFECGRPSIQTQIRGHWSIGRKRPV